MKASKIHLVWGVVAILFATVVGVVIANRKEASFVHREAKLRGDIKRLEKQLLPSSHPPAAATVASVTEEQPDATHESSGEASSSDGGNRNASGAETSREGRRSREGNGENLSKDQIMALLSKENRDRGDLYRALRSASELKDPAEKLEVLKALLDVDDGRVEYRAFSMILEMGGSEATKLAVDTVREGESHWLRSRAADYLGNVGGPAAMAALQDAFQTGDQRTQTSSAVALAKLGFEGPTQQMIGQLGPTLRSTDGAFREDAIEMLGRLKSTSTFPYLAQMIHDPNSEVRNEVIRSLRNSGSEEAIPILKQMLNDPNPEVAKSAERAIERIKNPEEGERDRH